MWVKFVWCLVVCSLIACGKSENQEPPPEAVEKLERICEIRTRGNTTLPMHLFPSLEGAQEFDEALRFRDADRVNAVLARHGAHTVPGGSKCQMMDLKGDFALVYATEHDVTGWIWYNDVRRDPNKP
jgi:hypothetical protein